MEVVRVRVKTRAPASVGALVWFRRCAKLSGKTRGDGVERRPRPIFGRSGRPADVNEAGDALVRRKPERIERVAVVSVPLGDPVRA